MKRIVLVAVLLIAAANAYALETMLSKARDITLPSLQYREATIGAILEDIRTKSVELDAEGLGINFVITLDNDLLNKQLTMTLNNPTIERALKLIAAVAPVYFQYEPSAVLVKNLSVNADTTEK
mgnify:CR=1 FL=1